VLALPQLQNRFRVQLVLSVRATELTADFPKRRGRPRHSRNQTR